MQKIIFINQPKVFNLNDAHAILPVIYRVTESAHNLVKSLINRMDSVKSVNPVLATEIEQQIDIEVHKWESKIQKLGASPKGLWICDFDNGQGFYCWKFPETKISFFHAYEEGFTGRKQIDTVKDNFETL